jgi:rhomboid protease GluP
MDYLTITFWLVSLSCLSGAIVGLKRIRSAGAGWVVIYVLILTVSVSGRLSGQGIFVCIAAGMWFVLVLLPGLIARQYQRCFFEQRYSDARRWAIVIGWLHPADGWRQLPSIVYALELAQQGELARASEILQPFQNVKSLIGLAAITNLYRITQQWEELLVWYERHLHEIDVHPQLLPTLLRALGETGDVRGLVELYNQRRHEIAKLVPPTSRDVCRLELFAFCGKRQAVEGLFAGGLARIPSAMKAFWLATADLASGAVDSGRRQLEELLQSADPVQRGAIERRLSRISNTPEPLDDLAERVIAEAAREQGHDERFGAQRSLFSRQALATQIIIVANIAMFAAEIALGGGDNAETLYRLGALFPPAVRAGEWWRLIASLFLHFGPLHIAMNMLGMWVLGPFVEFALGFRRFVYVYLLTGIGSMWVVMHLGPPRQMTVGASGCIMGLVGATGALMLRGWLRERALAAKRRLIAVSTIVLMQTIFDSMVPQVSMTGHLSGTVIGFAITLILGDRLRAAARQSSAPEPQSVKPTTA